MTKLLSILLTMSLSVLISTAQDEKWLCLIDRVNDKLDFQSSEKAILVAPDAQILIIKSSAVDAIAEIVKIKNGAMNAIFSINNSNINLDKFPPDKLLYFVESKRNIKEITNNEENKILWSCDYQKYILYITSEKKIIIDTDKILADGLTLHKKK